MIKGYFLYSLIGIFAFIESSWAIKIQVYGGYTRERNLPLVITETSSRLLRTVINGLPIIMKSYDSFRIISLSRGINTIAVSEYFPDGTNKIYGASDYVTIFADVTPVPLKIIHTWDTEDNYIDVYIKEPTGEVCYYAHRYTKLGGIMDIGSDTVGYGPQIYVMPFPNPGVYEIYVQYWGGSRSKLSEITTYVILYEGTEKEKRYIFNATLTAPGDRIFIGKVELK